MTSLHTHIWIVLVPLIFTGSLHMVVVKKHYLEALNIPIWKDGFGENKTWRGFVFVPLLNGWFSMVLAPALYDQPSNHFWMGYALGICYLIAELPNSYLKRKAGIKPGGHANSNKLFFFALDKTDSALGVTLGYYFLSDISISMAIALFLVSSITHALVSLLLVQLKIKSSI
jgi:CDP-diacylglycerol--serine O-phosphatidyltransferase